MTDVTRVNLREDVEDFAAGQGMVVEGGGRVRAGDETIALRRWDAVRIPGPVWRCFEAGDEGMALIIAGEPPMDDPVGQSGFAPGWWGRD